MIFERCVSFIDWIHSDWLIVGHSLLAQLCVEVILKEIYFVLLQFWKTQSCFMTTMELCLWFVVITTVFWLNYRDAIVLTLNQLLRLIVILKCWKICFLLFLHRVYAFFGKWTHLLWIVDNLNIIYHRHYAVFLSCNRSFVVYFVIRVFVILKQIFKVAAKWMVSITAVCLCIWFSGSVCLNGFFFFCLLDLI